MPKPPGLPRIRLNLDILPSTKDKIKYIMEAADVNSMTEVIRRGISILYILIRHKGEIVLRSRDKEEKILVLY